MSEKKKKSIVTGIANMTRYIIFALLVFVVYQMYSMPNDVVVQDQITITKEQFGAKWPLSVDVGIVKCLDIGNGSVVFESGGKTYAVNGTAKGFAKRHGFHAIDDIWLVDPNFFKMAREIAESEKKPVKEIIKAMGTPSKISIGPVLDSGLKLCK